MTNKDIFRSILSKVKAGERPTSSEVSLVRNSLQSAKAGDDIYAQARIFAHAVPPTEENVSMLSKFLNLDVDDHSLTGVIMGMHYAWELTGVDVSKLREIAKITSSASHVDSMYAAIDALGYGAFFHKNKQMLQALVDLYEEAKIWRFDSREEKEEYLFSVLAAIEVAIDGPNSKLSYPEDIDVYVWEKEILPRAYNNLKV